MRCVTTGPVTEAGTTPCCQGAHGCEGGMQAALTHLAPPLLVPFPHLRGLKILLASKPCWRYYTTASSGNSGMMCMMAAALAHGCEQPVTWRSQGPNYLARCRRRLRFRRRIRFFLSKGKKGKGWGNGSVSEYRLSSAFQAGMHCWQHRSKKAAAHLHYIVGGWPKMMDWGGRVVCGARGRGGSCQSMAEQEHCSLCAICENINAQYHSTLPS